MDLLSHHLNYDFRSAVQNGDIDIIKKLILNCQVDPGAKNNWALRTAIKHKYQDIVKLLVKSPRINLSSMISTSFVFDTVVKGKYGEISDYITLFLSRKIQLIKILPLITDVICVIFDMYASCMESLIQTDFYLNSTFQCSVQNSDFRTVDKLINNPRVNVCLNNNVAIRFAIKMKSVPLMKLLLKNPHVNPESFTPNPTIIGGEYSEIDIVIINFLFYKYRLIKSLELPNDIINLILRIYHPKNIYLK